MRKPPELCIGMPVYNGEAYMAAAVESILAQSHGDLLLLISDNASTDGTADIANQFAKADKRVRHLRNPTNLGAHPNYNRCFQVSSSPYFKWCNHDDVLEANYVASCLKQLKATPGAVLCQSLIGYIDAKGCPLGIYDSNLAGADSRSPAVRWSALINRPHTCYEVFGIFRASVLARSDRLQSFHGADRLLLAHMALHGTLIQVREPLMRMRDHAGRYTRRLRKPKERAEWHDARLKGQLSFPTWRLYSEYLKLLQREAALLGRSDFLRCSASALRWWTADRNAIRMASDLMAALAPDLLVRLQDFRAQNFGAAKAPDDDLKPDLSVRSPSSQG